MVIGMHLAMKRQLIKWDFIMLEKFYDDLSIYGYNFGIEISPQEHALKIIDSTPGLHKNLYDFFTGLQVRIFQYYLFTHQPEIVQEDFTSWLSSIFSGVMGEQNVVTLRETKECKIRMRNMYPRKHWLPEFVENIESPIENSLWYKG